MTVDVNRDRYGGLSVRHYLSYNTIITKTYYVAVILAPTLAPTILIFVKYFVARPCEPAEVGNGAGYDLKTTVWVDQAYDFLMHFFGRNLSLNNQFSCLPL